MTRAGHGAISYPCRNPIEPSLPWNTTLPWGQTHSQATRHGHRGPLDLSIISPANHTSETGRSCNWVIDHVAGDWGILGGLMVDCCL